LIRLHDNRFAKTFCCLGIALSPVIEQTASSIDLSALESGVMAELARDR